MSSISQKFAQNKAMIIGYGALGLGIIGYYQDVSMKVCAPVAAVGALVLLALSEGLFGSGKNEKPAQSDEPANRKRNSQPLIMK